MNSYLNGHYMRPCMNYLQKHNIAYQTSKFYTPVFDLALERDGIYLPLQRTLQWTKDLAEKNQIEDLHYQVGRTMGTGFLPEDIERNILNKANLFAALKAFYSYVMASQNDVSIRIFSLEKNLITIEIVKQTCIDKQPIWNASEWYSVWSSLQVMRQFLGENWTPLELELCTYNPIPELAKRDFVNTKFALGKGHVRITLAKADLGLIDDSILDEEVIFKVSNFDIKDNLEQVLLPILDQPDLNIDTAAILLDKSTRKLQRELKSLGLQFRNILRSLRMKSALKLLLDGSFSIKDVAEKVGYSKSTNFTRAFKTEFGVLPKDFLLANRV